MKQDEPQMKRISNYVLYKKIGQGATAEVYKAYEITTKKLVAIKVLSCKKLESESMSDLLANELDLLKAFHHKNIIQIQDKKKTSNNIYVILEYCNGNTLNHYRSAYSSLFNKQLPEELVQKIVKQIIQGLSFLHKSRCIHRDIKLDNILLNFDSFPNVETFNESSSAIPIERQYDVKEPFTVKIADLGFARSLNERNIASTICGTPITMSPDVFNWAEKIDQPHFYNEKADLWSLGAITYELLIGKPPFLGSDQASLFRMVKEGKYWFPKEMRLSVEAIGFINGLLQFYPEKRMDWPQIFAHPFITRQFDQLNVMDLVGIGIGGEEKDGVEFNAKERNDFNWMKSEEKTIQSIENEENEEVKKEVTEDNELLMKKLTEENEQLRMTIKELNTTLAERTDRKEENDELKRQLMLKIEENERLQKEIDALNTKENECLIVNDYFFNSQDNNQSSMPKSTIERNSFDWEIIPDSSTTIKTTIHLRSSCNPPELNNDRQPSLNEKQSKTSFDFIHDFFS